MVWVFLYSAFFTCLYVFPLCLDFSCSNMTFDYTAEFMFCSCNLSLLLPSAGSTSLHSTWHLVVISTPGINH